MNNKITFIHAADLHLDSPFTGLTNIPEEIFQEIKNSTYTALDHLVRLAIKKQVDFVLLVGDLFDNDKQSLKAQVKLRDAFEQLAEHQILVYLSYGNHDFMNGNKYPITYPSNVHVFPDETVRSFTFQKDNQKVASIYGFSYENRAVTDKKVIEYEVNDNKIPFHIAMLHGSFGKNDIHDTYAPFQLRDLIAQPFDYWALGHIHKREVIHQHPPIIYPGNIQGRNRKEIGEKGCYYVSMTKTEIEKEFVPLQSIQFNSLTLDVSKAETIDQLETIVKTELARLRTNTPQLLEVTLESNQELLIDWKVNHLLEELFEIINEGFLQQTNWVFIYKYNVQLLRNISELLIDGEHFIGELQHHFQDAPIREYVKTLYGHREAKKYLSKLTEEEKVEINQEAEELLIYELSKSD